MARPVAIKIAPKESEPDNEKTHAQREAITLAKFQHPNIVTVYDVLETDTETAIIMEQVDSPGSSLDKLIGRTGLRDETGKLDIRRISNIMQQAADGLDCTHSRGVIHCDIKPHNILITQEGIVKICDFGIAKTEDRFEHEIGTPRYLPPEMLSDELKPVSDVFSLGITAYEMLTGKSPYGDIEHMKMWELVEVIAKYRHKEFDHQTEQQLRQDGIDIDQLDEVFTKALARKPIDRYQSAGEFAAELSAALTQSI